MPNPLPASSAAADSRNLSSRYADFDAGETERRAVGVSSPPGDRLSEVFLSLLSNMRQRRTAAEARESSTNGAVPSTSIAVSEALEENVPNPALGQTPEANSAYEGIIELIVEEDTQPSGASLDESATTRQVGGREASSSSSRPFHTQRRYVFVSRTSADDSSVAEAAASAAIEFRRRLQQSRNGVSASGSRVRTGSARQRRELAFSGSVTSPYPTAPPQQSIIQRREPPPLTAMNVYSPTSPSFQPLFLPPEIDTNVARQEVDSLDTSYQAQGEEIFHYDGPPTRNVEVGELPWNTFQRLQHTNDHQLRRRRIRNLSREARSLTHPSITGLNFPDIADTLDSDRLSGRPTAELKHDDPDHLYVAAMRRLMARATDPESLHTLLMHLVLLESGDNEDILDSLIDAADLRKPNGPWCICGRRRWKRQREVSGASSSGSSVTARRTRRRVSTGSTAGPNPDDPSAASSSSSNVERRTSSNPRTRLLGALSELLPSTRFDEPQTEEPEHAVERDSRRAPGVVQGSSRLALEWLDANGELAHPEANIERIRRNLIWRWEMLRGRAKFDDGDDDEDSSDSDEDEEDEEEELAEFGEPYDPMDTGDDIDEDVVVERNVVQPDPDHYVSLLGGGNLNIGHGLDDVLR